MGYACKLGANNYSEDGNIVDHVYNSTDSAQGASSTFLAYRKPDIFVGEYGRYGSGYMFVMFKDGTTYNYNNQNGFQGSMLYDENTHIVTINNPNYGQNYSTGFVLYKKDIHNIDIIITNKSSTTSTMTFDNIPHNPKAIFIVYGYGSGYTASTLIVEIKKELYCMYEGIAGRGYPKYTYCSWDKNTNQLTITALYAHSYYYPWLLYCLY